jgi:hypothetical protein
MSQMNRHFISKGLFVVLTIFFVVIQTGISLAQEDKWNPCGNNDVCRQLLEKGRIAYEQGLYYKAGRYFNRAVNISPVGMAVEWYKMKGQVIKTTVETDKERLKPQPPVDTSLKKEEQAEEPAVIMGDDEGC